MWLDELRLWIRNYPRSVKPAARRRKTNRRLYVEALENRVCLSAFNAATTAALIADIHSANTNGAAANTINLTGNGPYSLTGMNNNTNGPNGLPVIGSKVASTLTINGNGNIIENGSDTPFRFFEIAPGSGGSLVLQNIELQGGSADGSGTSAEGGAIFNNGTLNVDGGVQLFDNKAMGTGFTPDGAGNSAAGGGIYSTAGGTLKFNGNNLIEACYAFGGFAALDTAGGGGDASGGGVFANTTTPTSLSSTTGTVVEACQAIGGTGAGGGTAFASGADGGSALGGGLFVSGSSTAKATLTGFTFNNDEAFGGNGGAGAFGKQGGNGGTGGYGLGGGIFASGGTVTDSGFINVLDCEAGGGAGGAGGNGNFTGGGNGGLGGNGLGGGVAAVNATVNLSASPTIENNLAIGGGGGNGGAAVGSATTGGKGGNSGIGSGGGLYANVVNGAAVTVTVKNALVSNNTAEEFRPGVGGKGFPGFGGAGGSYTGGFGGGIYLNQNAILASDTINSNSAVGGLIVPGAGLTRSPAGTGKSGGAGGNGATGAGGGLFVAGFGTITVNSCTFEFDKAVGGLGGSALGPKAGAPGLGGVGRGGAVDVEFGTVTISKSQIETNYALGASAAGTPSGGHSQGGAAAGGGLYAGGGTIHLTSDFIQRNLAAGDYNPITGSPNFGYGGGIYEVAGTTLTQDAFTSANLANNTGTAFNSDNFASGGPMG